MGRRKIQSEAEARRCIARVARSGLTPAAWARSVGIDGRSLHAWTVNLARGDRGRLASGESPSRGRRRRAKLVELVPAQIISSHSASYVVRVGQVAVEVGDQYDEDALRRLIGVLRSC
jgi:hypothetical protein